MATRKRKRKVTVEDLEGAVVKKKRSKAEDPMSTIGLYVMVGGIAALAGNWYTLLWTTMAFLVIVLFRWVMRMLNLEGD